MSGNFDILLYFFLTYLHSQPFNLHNVLTIRRIFFWVNNREKKDVRGKKYQSRIQTTNFELGRGVP